MTSAPFERTACACQACTDCCRRQPGPLVPDDLPRLAARLGLSVEALARRYLVASPGALVKDTATGRRFLIGTIVPRRKAYSGECVFLTVDGRCRVHEVAPFGCAYFDMHMGHDEAQRRAVWYLREIGQSEAYARLREQIPEATAWRPLPFTEEETK